MIPCTERKIKNSVILGYAASSKPVWATWDLIKKKVKAEDNVFKSSDAGDPGWRKDVTKGPTG